jgi:hypothetical protein
MPRQLKNLVIDEVSSVDRGAGKGVHVLLRKQQQTEEPMDNILKAISDVLPVPFETKVARVLKMKAEGVVTEFDGAHLDQFLAAQYRPGDRQALSKLYADYPELCNSAVRKAYADGQLAAAAGNAEIIEKSKGRPKAKPHKEMPPLPNAADDEDEDGKTPAEKIAHLQKTQNLNWDQAATVVFRKML